MDFSANGGAYGGSGKIFRGFYGWVRISDLYDFIHVIWKLNSWLLGSAFHSEYGGHHRSKPFPLFTTGLKFVLVMVVVVGCQSDAWTNFGSPNRKLLKRGAGWWERRGKCNGLKFPGINSKKAMFFPPIASYKGSLLLWWTKCSPLCVLFPSLAIPVFAALATLYFSASLSCSLPSLPLLPCLVTLSSFMIAAFAGSSPGLLS